MIPAQTIIDTFRNRYRMLAPDRDSVAVAKDIWLEWEKSGIQPPDVDAIAKAHLQHELGFFYDIVRIAERKTGTKLPIHYCAFCLDAYNFYAFSADDGYIVLIDDNFFQLLFFLTIVLVFEAQGCIEKEEYESFQALCRELIRNNYFERRRFDFSKEPLIPALMRRDYELVEFANYFFHSLKAFIITHEIAHHVLGHTSGKVRKVFSMDQGTKRVEVEVDQRSIDDEFEADRYGYELFRTVSDTVDEQIKYAYCKYKFDFAPLFLFDLFACLDRLTEQATQQPVAYRTHPDPTQRIEALQGHFQVAGDDPFYLGLKEALAILGTA